jgi:Asp-tRNA(Asn)/Glu-tRNA(Gln) amidotransferase C subunit
MFTSEAAWKDECFGQPGWSVQKFIESRRVDASHSLDVERIGRLSYLDGAESMKEDMVKILEFSTLVERISEDGVGDVIVDPEHTLRLREDRVTEGGIAQELLRNSSCTFGKFFSVQNKKDE